MRKINRGNPTVKNFSSKTALTLCDYAWLTLHEYFKFKQQSSDVSSSPTYPFSFPLPLLLPLYPSMKMSERDLGTLRITRLMYTLRITVDIFNWLKIKANSSKIDEKKREVNMINQETISTNQPGSIPRLTQVVPNP